jgi:hypothetical protein
VENCARRILPSSAVPASAAQAAFEARNARGLHVHAPALPVAREQLPLCPAKRPITGAGGYLPVIANNRPEAEAGQGNLPGEEQPSGHRNVAPYVIGLHIAPPRHEFVVIAPDLQTRAQRFGRFEQGTLPAAAGSIQGPFWPTGACRATMLLSADDACTACRPAL